MRPLTWTVGSHGPPISAAGGALCSCSMYSGWDSQLWQGHTSCSTEIAKVFNQIANTELLPAEDGSTLQQLGSLFWTLLATEQLMAHQHSASKSEDYMGLVIILIWD